MAGSPPRRTALSLGGRPHLAFRRTSSSGALPSLSDRQGVWHTSGRPPQLLSCQLPRSKAFPAAGAPRPAGLRLRTWRPPGEGHPLCYISQYFPGGHSWTLLSLGLGPRKDTTSFCPAPHSSCAATSLKHWLQRFVTAVMVFGVGKALWRRWVVVLFPPSQNALTSWMKKLWHIQVNLFHPILFTLSSCKRSFQSHVGHSVVWFFTI